MPGLISMRKAKVLAVDDTPANLLSMEVVLGSEFEMIRAASGEEALRILGQRDDIDVILLDVQMPGIDGFETARRIKKIDSAREVPIIFVTAIYKEDPFVKKGYEVGGMDYFGKPFDPDILRAKLAVYASFRMKKALLLERERQVLVSEELLRVGRRLASVLENLPVGVLITDLQGRMQSATPEVGRILGAAGQDAHAARLAEVLRDSATCSGRILEIEDGVASKTVLVSVTPLHRYGGEIIGAVVLLQDVSEQRRAGDDLERYVARMARAEEAAWTELGDWKRPGAA